MRRSRIALPLFLLPLMLFAATAHGNSTAPKDALSGTVTADVHALYGTESTESLPLMDARVAVDGVGVALTDEEGAYAIEAGAGAKDVHATLAGPYGQAVNAAGANGAIDTTGTPGSTLNLDWTDGNSTAAERDVFYHAMKAHAAMKSLDGGFTGLDYVVPINVNAVGDCLAEWDGDAFTFSAAGATCGNMATFADVVYRAYGIAVTDKIYGEAGSKADDAATIAEAFADYFAATLTGDPLLFENVNAAGVMERDIGAPDRTVDEINGDPLEDALILSGALWDMRQNLIDSLGEGIGAAIADALHHNARLALPETFDDVFAALLVADDPDENLDNGTPHSFEIFEAFGRHGIGPGAGLFLSSYAIDDGEDGDGIIDPGETIELTVTVSSRWKASGSIVLTLATADPMVTIENPEIAMPFVEGWSKVDAPEPFTIEVSPDIPFGQQIAFTLTIDEGGGAYTNVTNIALTVGSFQVLLVDDDGGGIYEAFFAEPLTSSGYSFSVWDVAAVGAGPSAGILDAYKAVVWNLGPAEEDTLIDEDIDALTSYLDAGGAVFITGQGLLNDLGEQSVFVDDYLHLSGFTLDVGADVAWGPGTDTMTNGILIDPLLHVFDDGSDAFGVDADASGALLNGQGQVCAVKYPMLTGAPGPRVVFFSFPFESIPDYLTAPSDPKSVMKRVLDFLIPTRVERTSPAAGDANVGINAPVAITFNKAVDPASVQWLVGPDPGGWSSEWSADNRTLTLTHTEPFACCGAEYAVQITAATDTAGNPLEPGHVDNPFSFTTAHPPVLTGLSPGRAAKDAETAVIVRGEHFLETPEVTVGGEPCTDVMWRDETTLAATVPPMDKGEYDVVVTNPDGQSATLADGFEVTEESDDDDDDEGCGCSVNDDDSGPGGLMPLALLLLGFIILRSKRGRSWK